MKKVIGIAITLAGAVLTVVLWHVLGLAFELEGLTRDRIGLAVVAASLAPLAVYIGAVIYACCRYNKRLDANSYQPFHRFPVGSVVNAAVQVLIMWVLGMPTQSVGQATAAFTAAVIAVVLLGAVSLGTALICGRPVGGKTCLPFVRLHKYQ